MSLKDINNSLPKTKTTVWIKTFITSFLLPIGLLFRDAGFDVLLVKQYKSEWDQEDDDEFKYYKHCDSHGNHSIVSRSYDESCESALSPTMPFVCHPLKLNTKSKFFYSLFFVLFPFFFYFHEFLHSTYNEQFIKVNNVY